MEYGPYSPQEVERIVAWLNKKAVSFQILRNDQDEKEALMNDGLNALRLADLRTGIYLGQIFYIVLNNAVPEVHKQFTELFSRPQESFAHPERFQPSLEEENNLVADAYSHEKVQRSWAKWLVLAMMINVLIVAIMIIFK